MIIAKLAAGVCILIWDMYTPPRSNPPEVGIVHALRPSMPDRESVSAAALLGFALVARGEIGVLIATVATSPPSEVLGNDAYINAIWAILMCTIIGPLAVGWIVRREGERIVDGRWGQSPQRSEWKTIDEIDILKLWCLDNIHVIDAGNSYNAYSKKKEECREKKRNQTAVSESQGLLFPFWSKSKADHTSKEGMLAAGNVSGGAEDVVYAGGATP
jgi:hypothetical protein